MPDLYQLIADLRTEYQTQAAVRTLDLVVSELGETRDNLGRALARIEPRAVPAGGRPVLDELADRARMLGLDRLETPVSDAERRAGQERVDGSQVGIALLLGGSALVPLVLVVVVIVAQLNAIFHWA